MLWTPNEPPISSDLVDRLVPNEVLYFYDGPILFTMRMGFLDVLAYKVDENDELDLFLLKLISGEEISRLRQGRLSLRGALQAPSYWLVETRKSLQTTRAWLTLAECLPELFLPTPGLGLTVGLGRLPDTLLQSDSFFSVRFTGSDMQRGHVSFRTFKELTDQFYNASNRLLKPDALLGMKGREAFDIPMREPQFASLLIALDKPVINTAFVDARKRAIGDFTSRDYSSEIIRKRQGIFSAFGEVTSEANRGSVSPASAINHFTLLGLLEGLLPSKDGSIQTTEFSASGELAGEHVFLDAQAGSIIRSAFIAARTEPHEVTGQIEVVNSPSSTFVVRDFISGRRITCFIRREWFEKAVESGELRNGNIAAVFGAVQRRTYRDMMDVSREPAFPPSV